MTAAVRVPPRGGVRVYRPTTVEARECAVRRVIAVMRERYAESLSLEQLSNIAISSPFHFNRVFREVTGLPPLRFLSAVRLQVAKHLLLTTRRSVTNICFGVGYSSLGTFTTHFAEYVGAPPTQFRRLSAIARIADLLPTPIPEPDVVLPETGCVRGRVRAPSRDAGEGAAIVGLFTSRLPRGQPRACAVAPIGGTFSLDGVAPGSYHLFSVVVNTFANGFDLFLGESMRVGHVGPIIVRDAGELAPIDVELRWPRDTDPPLLVALPVLMAKRMALQRASG